MDEQLEHIRADFRSAIATARDPGAIEALRVEFLGRTGRVTRVSEGMKNLDPSERPRIGKLLHEVRSMITSALNEAAARLEAEADARRLAGIDLSLPGRMVPRGALHPITQLLERMVAVMRRMGFALEDGPDIETEWHCFDALNTPADHPARNEQDTFYLPDGRLLRTQTSPVQIRVMERQAPPIRIIAPGACYRRDEVDATHLSQFNQVEGLCVAPGISLADLKSTVTYFIRETFGAETEIRFRPHFFPFTEPSYEIDIQLHAEGREPVWMELAGCGMVDPAVFERVCESRGDRVYDPEAVSGFAFGFGVDRLAMLLTGLPDIRLLIENDIRFLSQFPS